jgi:two-component system, NarL family, response regulator
VTPPTPRKIRVMIVDDHVYVRLGVAAVVNGQPDMEVVGDYASAEDAIAAVAGHAPQVIVMDLRMPGMGGVAAIPSLRKESPETKVLVLTTYEGDEDVYRALQAGANGFVLKGQIHGVLLDGIRAVASGQTFIPTEVARRLAQRLRSPGLSEREIQVLELVARGLSNDEIGAALDVTGGTVKSYLKRIYTKLDVNARTEAVTVAIERGFLRL